MMNKQNQIKRIKYLFYKKHITQFELFSTEDDADSNVIVIFKNPETNEKYKAYLDENSDLITEFIAHDAQ